MAHIDESLTQPETVKVTSPPQIGQRPDLIRDQINFDEIRVLNRIDNLEHIVKSLTAQLAALNKTLHAQAVQVAKLKAIAAEYEAHEHDLRGSIGFVLGTLIEGSHALFLFVPTASEVPTSTFGPTVGT